MGKMEEMERQEGEKKNLGNYVNQCLAKMDVYMLQDKI